MITMAESREKESSEKASSRKARLLQSKGPPRGVPIMLVGKIKIECRIAADGFIEAMEKRAGPRAGAD